MWENSFSTAYFAYTQNFLKEISSTRFKFDLTLQNLQQKKTSTGI